MLTLKFGTQKAAYLDVSIDTFIFSYEMCVNFIDKYELRSKYPRI